MSSPAFVYILSCADGTFYTGSTKNLEKRLAVHNTGRGARYTAGRRPVALIYSEPCASWGNALRRECEIKRLSRKQKEALVAEGRDLGTKRVGQS